jgi:Family of unknown function (DUF5719)
MSLHSKRVLATAVIAVAAVIVVLLLPAPVFGYYSWVRTGLYQNVQSLAYNGVTNILYSGCADGIVYRNNFKGGGWSNIGNLASGPVFSLAYDAEHNVLYAGCNSGSVFKNAFKGAGWVTTGNLAPAPVLSLSYDASHNILYAGCADNNVYKNDFKGAGWITTGNLLAGPVHSLAYDASRNILYAGCADNNVYKNDFKGAGWITTGNLASGNVYSLARDSSRNVLYAGCANGNVLKNAFRGAGWVSTGSPTAASVYSLACDETNNLLYAGTSGMSVDNVFKKDLSSNGSWFAIGRLCGGGAVNALKKPAGTNILYAGTADSPPLNQDVYRFSLPSVSSVDPPSAKRGATLDVTINGKNTDIHSSAAAHFSGSGITVNSTSRLSATKVTANISIDAGAALGARDVWVTYRDSNGVYDRANLLPGAFTVAPATTFYFAEGSCRPGFDPYICIQNPGDQDAEVTITYMKGNGTQDFQDTTVPRNSRSTVTVKDRLGEGDDVSHDFSCTVECTNGQEIIAERPMYFNYNGVWTGGHDVVGALAPSSAFFFAEGTCRPGFDPYICIQNPGANDAPVLITYMKGDGTTDTETLNVPANSRSTVTVKNKLGEGDDVSHDFSCTVECTNGQGIIAERPMYFSYKGVWTGGHDVVGALAPAKTFYFAEGTCRPGFDPYICIQNPGSSDAHVTITYMKGDGSTDSENLTVGKNSRYTVTVKNVLGEANDSAHDFSCTVECTNGQGIIAERPMYFNYNGVWTGGHDVVGLTP